EEQDIIDDVLAMYDFDFIRREMIGDVPTIYITYKPKPNYKPKTGDGKMLQKISGHVWIAEDDHEIAKLDGEVMEPISIGAGLLAKLHKGSRVGLERRKINGEVWLPIKEEAFIDARFLVLKGIKELVTVEYSDHKK